MGNKKEEQKDKVLPRMEAGELEESKAADLDMDLADLDFEPDEEFKLDTEWEEESEDFNLYNIDEMIPDFNLEEDAFTDLDEKEDTKLQKETKKKDTEKDSNQEKTEKTTPKQTISEETENNGLDPDLLSMLGMLDNTDQKTEEKKREEPQKETDLDTLLSSLDTESASEKPKESKTERILEPLEEVLSMLDTKSASEKPKESKTERILEPLEEAFSMLDTKSAPEKPKENKTERILEPLEEVLSMGKLLEEEEDSSEKTREKGSDLGNVFSDVLGAVDTLKDAEAEQEIINSDRKESTKKEKKKKEQDGESSGLKGWIKKIFGNVPDNRAEKEKPEKPEKPAKPELTPEQKKAKKKEAEKEKKAKKAEKAAIAEKAKQEKLKAKQEKKKQAQSKNKEAAEEEVEEKTRINPIGTAVIFTFFGVIAFVILGGTDLFTYNNSIAAAAEEFEQSQYNEAYNEIRGIKIKPKDMELHDKIMTVMYVNKQLNSYNNYIVLENYPEALHSLLKGLERYDKYIALAKELGIKSDLDYVRGQIMAELKKEFSVSEEDASELLKIVDQAEYSKKIYQIVAKHK